MFKIESDFLPKCLKLNGSAFVSSCTRHGHHEPRWTRKGNHIHTGAKLAFSKCELDHAFMTRSLRIKYSNYTWARCQITVQSWLITAVFSDRCLRQVIRCAFDSGRARAHMWKFKRHLYELYPLLINYKTTKMFIYTWRIRIAAW